MEGSTRTAPTSFADLGHSMAVSGRCCLASCSTGVGTGTALLPLPLGLPGWEITAATCTHPRHPSAPAAGDVVLSQEHGTQTINYRQAAASVGAYDSNHIWAPYLKARGLLLGCHQQFLQYNGSNLRHMAPKKEVSSAILLVDHLKCLKALQCAPLVFPGRPHASSVQHLLWCWPALLLLVYARSVLRQQRACKRNHNAAHTVLTDASCPLECLSVLQDRSTEVDYSCCRDHQFRVLQDQHNTRRPGRLIALRADEHTLRGNRHLGWPSNRPTKVDTSPSCGCREVQLESTVSDVK